MGNLEILKGGSLAAAHQGGCRDSKSLGERMNISGQHSRLAPWVEATSGRSWLAPI
jgi:hypothetical protein